MPLAATALHARIDHPAAHVAFAVPDGFAVSPLPQPWTREGTARRQVLLRNGAPRAQVLALSRAKLDPLHNLRDLVALVLLNGAVSELTPVDQTQPGQAPVGAEPRAYRFLLNGAAHIVWIATVPLGAAPEAGLLYLSSWGTAAESVEIRSVVAELLRELRIEPVVAARFSLPRACLFLALGTNLLQAVLSILGGVPLYALGHSAHEPMVAASLFVIVVLATLAVGAWRRRLWGVMGSALTLGLLGTTGAISAIGASGGGFYLPAMEAGGIHALLWVVNLSLNLGVAAVVFFAQRKLIDTES
jgi:hypothetical protein